MQSGLPVLASVNAGNDLVGLIDEARVGRLGDRRVYRVLARAAVELVDAVPALDAGFCRALQDIVREAVLGRNRCAPNRGRPAAPRVIPCQTPRTRGRSGASREGLKATRLGG